MNQNIYPNSLYPQGTNTSQNNDQLSQNFNPFPNTNITPSNPFGTNTSNPPYAENLLSLNKGKRATFYMSYPDSIEWRDRIFTGIIQDAGRDYALLSDTNSEKWWLLWTVYLDYVEFDNEIIHF